MTTLRQYRLPSVKGEGWAIIVIGSDGFFSTVSDWGNYAYLWTHPGCEFRRFLAGLDADYFWSKIARGKRVFDDHETEKNIRTRLWDMMGERLIDITQHDAALEALDLSEGTHGIVHWANGLDFEFDYYEGIIETKREQDSWGFATKILPRFQKMLREELASEAPTAEGQCA